MMLSSGANQTIRRAAFIFVTFVLLLFRQVPNATAALQFDVFAGYDSFVRAGDWYPITFEISNDGPAFRAVIEISSGQLNRANSRRLLVELPTGTLKRITIPNFSGAGYSTLTVRLLSESGKIIEEKELGWQQLRQRSSQTIILGALSRTTAGLPSFPTIKVTQPEMQPAVARLQPAIFPDNPIALDGLSALYLSSERALDLKDVQIKSLLAWLQSGGHLIVGVDQVGDINGSPWLRDLLPCELSSAKNIKTGGAFLRWLQEETLKPKNEEDSDEIAKRPGIKPKKKNEGSTSPVLPGALFKAAGTNLVADPVFESAELQVAIAEVRRGNVLASAEGLPLAVQSFYGRGLITVLTFSPERQPFSAWENKSWWWALIAKVPVRFYESSDHNQWGWSLDGVFGSMIESDQLRKLPLVGLVGLLVLYLAVIGPIDQIILRRMKKQMLTWITFPCYVLIFSGLIYFIGFKLRAGDSEYNELHVVDIFPNKEKAILRGRTYASIYSPANVRYQLESEQFIASIRGEYISNWGSGEENSQARITQVGDRFSADIYVPVWTSQLYVNDWWQPTLASPMTVSVSAGSVTVKNNLERVLKQSWVCVDGMVYELGELPAEAEKEFVLKDLKGISIGEFARKQSSDFFNAAEMRRQTFGSEASRIKWDLPRATSAACFVSEMNEDKNYRRFISAERLDLSDFARSGSVILLAWDGDNSFTRPLNRFTPRRSSQNTLLRMVIPSRINANSLSLSE